MLALLIANRPRSFLLAVSLIVGLIANPVRATAQADPPSVDKVIELHKMGISEPVLISWIKQANAPMKLTPEDLVKLSGAKVPDRVVQTLMDPTISSEMPLPPAPPPLVVTPNGVVGTAGTVARPSGATTDDRTAAGDPNDPLAAHDSGI